MNIFRRISRAVRGSDKDDKDHPLGTESKSPFPQWRQNAPGWVTPPPQDGWGDHHGWGANVNPSSSYYHDHSKVSSKDHYAQCAEIWDRHFNRWALFDPKDIPPQESKHESLAWFCVTARYNNYWSEPHHVLTHFAEPLSTFVTNVCNSYGSWGTTTVSSQPNDLEMGQALRTLKKAKAKFDEIRERKSKNKEEKLTLVRSLGNIAVDDRTPETELDTYLKDMEKQLKVFVSYLETKFKPIAERLANAIRYGYMEFDLLPYYFEPGQEVWFNSAYRQVAIKVSQVHVSGNIVACNGVGSEVSTISVKGHGYSWNGRFFETSVLEETCFSFAGRKEIWTLPVQLMTPEKREELTGRLPFSPFTPPPPIPYPPLPSLVRVYGALIRMYATARGRRYKAEAGINYRIWRGERVVIDQLGYTDAQHYDMNNNQSNNMNDNGRRKKRRQRSHSFDAPPDSDPWGQGPVPGRIPVPNGAMCDVPPSPGRLPSMPSFPTFLEHTTGPQIDDDLLCFLPTDLFGYHLAKKEWQSFDLDGVKPVEFDGRAWEHLVLDQDVKTLIKGLVEVSTKTTAASGAIVNDVIARKGGGLTSVLYGPPGTGKTLTAEAVAELLKRPLLTVGSSDLPRDPSGMEDTLKYVLQLATAWDAVLLIDEADVFLEQRSLHEIERNALVSVALRVLEYHRGVVFLTTNRIKVFDEAFLSRFNIAVKYPELNQNGRYLIWSRFLELAGYKIVESPFITNDDLNHEKVIPRKSIEALAAKSFNGRTIKNLVRTAQALALSANSPLKMEHVHIVVRAQEKFLEDFAVERSSSD
ncbi:hypothetical protein V5O48_004215 [Marasmius crinis-equi]|uniref:AAA+ ATPase domain-containing protein n=1 Tax=Marasmius crinis-equi TaxID=585013 RepID=A0ABR3FQR2_9AGAR